jgi:hypothetical protein
LISGNSTASNLPSGNDRDLVHLEQRVNDRIGTDPAPPLPPELLPDRGGWQPLSWLHVPENELELFCDRPDASAAWRQALRCGPHQTLFPVHPLLERHLPNFPRAEMGRFAVSASYRTVFYEPVAGSPLAALLPLDHWMVVKLHLDEPLPGIPGDRRLTRDKVRKCVALSSVLPELVSSVSVVREPLGLVYGDRGALLRFVPKKNVVPVFALFSRDSARPAEQLILLREFDRLGLTPSQVAERYGDLLAQPLIRAACAGFDQGFSFELHAQNTLVELGGQRLIQRVLFRDLESVLYFPRYRLSRGHAPLPMLEGNRELLPTPAEPLRWFNRNIDHDIGRILRGSLQALERVGFFSARDRRNAMRSCRSAHRAVVDEFGLRGLDWPGRRLRVSRSPYGRGLRRGDYYRPEFR